MEKCCGARWFTNDVTIWCIRVECCVSTDAHADAKSGGSSGLDLSGADSSLEDNEETGFIKCGNYLRN